MGHPRNWFRRNKGDGVDARRETVGGYPSSDRPASDLRPPRPDARFASRKPVHMVRQAHESTDDALIAHCAFCGSGRIYGRSDNTVVCEYCNRTFKVKVAPANPSMPQTDPATGEPIEVRPIDEPPAGVPESVDEEPNPFAASKYYLTAKGEALDEERFMKHLAITHADDPKVFKTRQS